jgi:WD40 repeat protein
MGEKKGMSQEEREAEAKKNAELKIQVDALKTAVEDKTKELKGKMSHKAAGVSSLPAFKTPECKRTVTTHLKKVYCASWNRDSMHMCTAGQEGIVLVNDASLNLAKKQPIKTPFVMQCAMHADDAVTNGLVACAGMKNLVEIWKIDPTSECKKKKDFEGHEGYISQIHFIGGGKTLLTGSGDGLAMLWDLEKMVQKQVFEGHEQDVSGVCIADADSKIFATSSTDKTCRVWDMRQKYSVRCFRAKYATNCCAMMPSSDGVMVGCDNASYEFFSIKCNQQVARGKVKKGRCESIAISSSGRSCYSGWDNGVICVADSYVPDNRKEMVYDKAAFKDMHQNSVCSLSVAPDGSALLSSSFDSTAKVWGAGEA